MHKNPNTMKQDDFKTQWQRSQQWQMEAEQSAPDDETLLRWVEQAQHSSAVQEVNPITFPSPRRQRWIPIAIAASLLIGVTVIGLTHQGQTDITTPIADEGNEEGQPIRFLCNNGCSAQDIILLANEVIK